MEKQISKECKAQIKMGLENLTCIARSGGEYPTEYFNKIYNFILETIQKEINTKDSIH